MRRDPDFFGEIELDLLYMARTLRAALRVEDMLTQSGIDYLVETGNYTAGLFILRELTGAYFYILPADVVRARALLLANRVKPYEDPNAVRPQARA